jgi:hypothetical protein
MPKRRVSRGNSRFSAKSINQFLAEGDRLAEADAQRQKKIEEHKKWQNRRDVKKAANAIRVREEGHAKLAREQAARSANRAAKTSTLTVSPQSSRVTKKAVRESRFALGETRVGKSTKPVVPSSSRDIALTGIKTHEGFTTKGTPGPPGTVGVTLTPTEFAEPQDINARAARGLGPTADQMKKIEAAEKRQAAMDVKMKARREARAAAERQKVESRPREFGTQKPKSKETPFKAEVASDIKFPKEVPGSAVEGTAKPKRQMSEKQKASLAKAHAAVRAKHKERKERAAAMGGVGGGGGMGGGGEQPRVPAGGPKGGQFASKG